jgi:spore coat protein A
MEKLAPFVDPLPIPALARPSGWRPHPQKPREKLPYYRLPMQPLLAQVHRDLPPTKLWGYGGTVPGPTMEVRQGQGVLVDWPNELPTRHLFPIDHNLMGAERNKPEVRTVVHLHGAKAPPLSDGYPENWYTAGKSAVYHYPNEQEAALLWYHDHAMGINRLNMMAGLFGLYIVRDFEEEKLELPSGKYEIPLVLFDRMLTYDGQLYYPVSNVEDAPWIPEFFGNAILINGKVRPYLEVEPRRYRFRILNASNGRFYTLSLANGSTFTQIGTDGGLVSVPLHSSVLHLAPAERADILIDFASQGGEELALLQGAIPILQFRVSKEGTGKAKPLPQTLRSVPVLAESEAVRTRHLTLEENDDVLDEPMTHLLNGSRWHDPVTEQPEIGTTEIWAFINLTDDSHPIHLHLVRFQILDRRSFDDVEYLVHKKVRYTDEPAPPSLGETGWKDTVQAHPKMVTRIIVRFEGYTGRYVWHCHILEHEDNEMMRPFDVLPAKRTGVGTVLH